MIAFSNVSRVLGASGKTRGHVSKTSFGCQDGKEERGYGKRRLLFPDRGCIIRNSLERRRVDYFI